MIELTSKTKPVIRVKVDFEKLKAPYSGLGQFCMHLAKEFEPNYEVGFTFFMPAKVTKFQGVSTRKVNPFFKVMKVPSRPTYGMLPIKELNILPGTLTLKWS